MDAERSGDAQGRGSLEDDAKSHGWMAAMAQLFEVNDPIELVEQPPRAAASSDSALGEGRAEVAPVAVQPLKPSMPDAPAVPRPPVQITEGMLVPTGREDFEEFVGELVRRQKVAVAAGVERVPPPPPLPPPPLPLVAESSALLRDASSLSLVEADPLLETAQETLEQKPDNLSVTSVLETDKDIIDADIGILTGNWGARVGAKKGSAEQAVQQNIDNQLKRCPA